MSSKTKKKDWDKICRELSSPESSDAEDVPNYKSVMKHTRRNFALAESILGKSGNSLPKFMGSASDLDRITTSFPKPLSDPTPLLFLLLLLLRTERRRRDRTDRKKERGTFF